MVIGTFWMGSERRCAVTTISLSLGVSAATVVVEAELEVDCVCVLAWACAPVGAAAASATSTAAVMSVGRTLSRSVVRIVSPGTMAFGANCGPKMIQRRSAPLLDRRRQSVDYG